MAARAVTTSEEVPSELSRRFSAPEQPGELGRLGRYALLRLLGGGGMGVVFEAEDPVLRRRVALKCMRPRLADQPAGSLRFLREAQAAARLMHDHLVPVFDVGEANGVSFLTMPLLQGQSLEERLRRDGVLPLPEVLRIGRQIAGGLAAAHAHGLIHRDIKPANVWLEGAAARVKLLDFGLARLTEETSASSLEVILGTPGYLSPEQAASRPLDHRADLFSLGCVLYRMTTGTLPFPGKDVLGLLNSLATSTPRPPRQLNPTLPPKLETLILRLLAKAPAERPASADEVSAVLADIEDELALPSVPSAVPPRRRRWSAVAAAVVVCAGVALAGYACFHSFSNVPKAGPDAVGLAFAPGKPLGPLSLVQQPAPLTGVLSWDIVTREPRGGWRSVAYRPDGRQLAILSSDGVVRICDVETGNLVRALMAPIEPGKEISISLAWAPDGTKLACAATSIAVWEAESGRLRHLFAGKSFRAVAWSPDGKLLAAVAKGAESGVWDVASGERLDLFEDVRDGASLLAWAPDSKSVAIVGWDGQRHLLCVYAVTERGAKVSRKLDKEDIPEMDAVTSVAWWPDGQSLLISTDYKAWKYDLAGRRLSEPLPELSGYLLAWLPEGKGLACSSGIWDPATQKLRKLPLPEKTYYGVVAWPADGKSYVATDPAGLQIYDAATERVTHALRFHGMDAGPLGVSPDGQQMVSAHPDRSLWLWDLASGQRRFISRYVSAHFAVAVQFSAHGKHVLVRIHASDNGILLDAATGKTLHELNRSFRGAACAPDGKTWALLGRDGRVVLWDSDSGNDLRTIGEPAPDTQLHPHAWSPDGKLLAMWRDNAYRLIDAANGQLLRTLRELPWWSPWSPDGRQYALPNSRLFDTASGKELQTLESPGFEIGGCLWSTNGQAFSGFGGSKGVTWDAQTGKITHRHEIPLTSYHAAIHGPPLFVGPFPSEAVRLWDWQKGRPLGTLVALRKEHALALSPDGHYRGTPRIDNELVYVVQTATGQDTLTPEEFAKKYGWKNDPEQVGLTKR